MRPSQNLSADRAMILALVASSLSSPRRRGGGACGRLLQRWRPDERTAASLQAAAPAAQALDVDVAIVKTGASYRCSGGRLLVCAVGANLWCGKADTDTRPARVAAYCRSNPDAVLAPMAVTGHATIYAWRCAHGAPEIEPSPMAVDPDGYIADNWRELD